MSISKKIHLRDGEEILEILRRYPLTYLHVYIFSLAVMSVATFFITWLFAQGWWGMTLYGLAMFCGFFLIGQTWYFARANMLIVTGQRVVDIARAGWLDEVVSSVGYADIMDISFRKRGLSPNFFNYGDIYLQTKSKQFVLEIAKIHQPQKTVNFIMEQIEFYRDGKGELTVEDIYDKFIKIIPELTDEELLGVDDIIHDQLGEEIEEVLEEEIVVE
jgi:hypothetical protein